MAFIPLATTFSGSSILRPPSVETSRPCASRPTPVATAVPRNGNFSKLQAGYLFPEINRRRRLYLSENPGADLISLGVGDTTQPIPSHICAGLVRAADQLASTQGYSGYGAEQGMDVLREKIAATLYAGRIHKEEVFVSDGAKCDITRLQQMFGRNVTVAVQDPSYPVYVDVAVMLGQTGNFDHTQGHFAGIEYMQCSAENDFFPDLDTVKRTDLIFFCSPNNPTGATASREQLQSLVNFAKANGSIIIFDAAYAPFINAPGVPTSIFEIDGARECAIEVNSFSKYAGFTGVRLGWTVIPNELAFADGSSVKNDFNRVMTTSFNGASNISQNGGLACLDPDGRKEVQGLIDYYLANAALLRNTMTDLGFDVYGGTDAPYIWVRFPGKKSWDVFSDILEKAQVVTVPGLGFGPGGEGYLRLSAFAPREACDEACKRLREMYASVVA